MCGVCGIVDLNNSPPITMDELIAMCKTIEHRGPDGTRTMIRDSIAMGHTRLSVIDKITGWQPITNEDGSMFVILNGEIYNFQELRKELIKLGHKFKTTSDTEVVIHLYEEEGNDFVKRLDGMFALAIWDEPKRRLILARDRIGKKPLFYSSNGRKLLFASEAKTLVQTGSLTPNIDPIALTSYLTYGYVPDPLSIFNGISKLPPAHILIYDNSGVRTQRYWELNKTIDKSITAKEAAAETRRLTDIAISSRLISDVPLGFFLSGGLDSSIVVGSAAQMTKSKIKTFSIGFEEKSYSELKFANIVAQRFETDHEEFTVTADLTSDLESIVRFADEPFADSSMIPMYYLSRQTRQHVTVALTGDGGDEAFGGYDRYIGLTMANKYHKLPGFLRKNLISPITKMIRESPGKKNNLRRLKRLTYPPTESAAQWYMGWMQQIRSETHANAFTPDFVSAVSRKGGWKDHMSAAFQRFGNSHTVRSAQWADSITYLPGDLMVKADRMSMAHGLEVRSPFLDHNLLDFASTIPDRYSISGRSGKQILKLAYSDLIPDEISRRPKAGFTVPVGEWIKGPLKDSTRDLLLAPYSEIHKIIRPQFIAQMLDQHWNYKQDHAIRLWNLICLETWARTFKVPLA
ncbi:MAG: asparagine synthase (glutamine-hydrolyzing) [Chloroflexota bacterium]|nr:asparagine synthase (glutamine-hydrolyzing) [Chloroflexota bacterium]